jgi:ParB/RepB/Spo0J family partition protein
MSLKFASSVKPERGAEFLVDLNDISVDHGTNNRFSQSDVKTLIQSISQYGQLEAVGAVRVKPSNTLRLAYGFGRYEAIKQINDSLPEDQRMKIKVVVFDGNERDVFFRNLAENAHRNELSHMDYSLAIRRMSENFGQSDSQIASFFGRTSAWVSQHRNLLSLDYTIQSKVHNGEMTFSDALAISKMSEEKQKEAVEAIKEITEPAEPEAKETVGEGGTEAIPAEATEEAKPAAEEKPAKKKKVKEIIRKLTEGKDHSKRSWNELHGFFEVMVGSPAISDELQKLSSVMLAIMTGEISDDSDAVDALEALIAGSKQ